jgi:hypothetical protein
MIDIGTEQHHVRITNQPIPQNIKEIIPSTRLAVAAPLLGLIIIFVTCCIGALKPTLGCPERVAGCPIICGCGGCPIICG